MDNKAIKEQIEELNNRIFLLEVAMNKRIEDDICFDKRISDLEDSSKSFTENWTDDEKAVAKFAKLNGTEFIARDNSGDIWMYPNTPQKKDVFWVSTTDIATRLFFDMPNVGMNRVYTADEILKGE